MSSHREITSKAGLVLDPSLVGEAMKPLAAMAQHIIDNSDLASRILDETGTDLPWLSQLAAQQIPLSEIEASTVSRMADILGLSFVDVFPVNPYRRIAQPSGEIQESSSLGRRLGDLDPTQLGALYQRATGALTQQCGA